MDFVLLREGCGGAESLGDDAWFAHLYSTYPVPAGHFQSGFHRAYPVARCSEFLLCALPKCAMVWKKAKSVRVFPFEGRKGKPILT